MRRVRRRLDLLPSLARGVACALCEAPMVPLLPRRKSARRPVLLRNARSQLVWGQRGAAAAAAVAGAAALALPLPWLHLRAAQGQVGRCAGLPAAACCLCCCLDVSRAALCGAPRPCLVKPALLDLQVGSSKGAGQGGAGAARADWHRRHTGC